jgi:long-chain acyl-CoA synthetase
MYLGDHARLTPTKAALINAATGRVTTYGELDRKSNYLAQALHALGLHAGDNVALLMENHPRFMEILWAAMQLGLNVTTISCLLAQDEVACICNVSGVKALISSSMQAPTAAGLPAKLPNCPILVMAGGASAGWQSYEAMVAAQPATAQGAEPRGQAPSFSPDTDGRFRDIDGPLLALAVASANDHATRAMRAFDFLPPRRCAKRCSGRLRWLRSAMAARLC